MIQNEDSLIENIRQADTFWNGATLASEKWHYCKAKQTILTFKIGTIPVLKWLRSSAADAILFLSTLGIHATRKGEKYYSRLTF